MIVFSKDFGGMCQGNNKTGQKGTDMMFIMDPHKVPNIPKNQPPTYAKITPKRRAPIASELWQVAKKAHH